MRFSKKFFLALALGSVSFLVNAQISQKEALEKFVATSGAKDTAKVQELLGLFDKIVDELKNGGEGVAKISESFYSLCATIVNADVSNSKSIEEIKAKLKELSILVNNDRVAPSGNTVINNISSFISLFEEFVNNPNVNSFFANVTQFVNQYKYGKEFVAATSAIVVAAIGTLIAWRIIKKDESTTSVVKPATSTTSSKEDGIEMTTFVDLTTTEPKDTNLVSPLPEPKPSENVEITPVDPVETTPTVVKANPTIDLTVPSSESGIDAQPKDHSSENAEEDSEEYKSLSDTQVIEIPADAKKQDDSKPTLERHDAFADLQPLIDEVTKQATQKIVEEKKVQPTIITRSGRVSKKPSSFGNDKSSKKKHQGRKR